MRKDSNIILSLSVILTGAIVGGTYYMAVVRQPAAVPEEKPTTWETIKPQTSQPIGNPDVSAETSSRRTNIPIKCYDEELGEFWTNAATCEGADLYNRISIAEPVVISPERERYGNENYRAPGQDAASKRTDSKSFRNLTARKPDLRRKAKEPPDGLPAECRFPVGEAAEMERKLSAKDDPKDSMWVEDYCEWRREVSQKRCQLPGGFFYYSYQELCQTNG